MVSAAQQACEGALGSGHVSPLLWHFPLPAVENSGLRRDAYLEKSGMPSSPASSAATLGWKPSERP